MNIDSLVGCQLTGCSFGKYWYNLEFYSSNADQNFKYLVGTPFNLSIGISGGIPSSDLGRNVSDALWPFLEATLVAVKPNANEKVWEFCFDNGDSIYIWASAEDDDSVAIVRKQNSDEWFAIG